MLQFSCGWQKVASPPFNMLTTAMPSPSKIRNSVAAILSFSGAMLPVTLPDNRPYQREAHGIVDVNMMEGVLLFDVG